LEQLGKSVKVNMSCLTSGI